MIFFIISRFLLIPVLKSGELAEKFLFQVCLFCSQHQVLEGTELGTDRVRVACWLYDGLTGIEATALVLDETDPEQAHLPIELPSERYLDILVQVWSFFSFLLNVF